MRLDQIRRLIELVSEADIAELEVREKFNSIRITKTDVLRCLRTMSTEV